MLSILQSDFFWGLIIGLLLSIAGAWAIAHFTFQNQQSNQRRLIKRLICDTAKNIANISEQFDDTRNRTQLIYEDFLMLIDIEVGIYGRNREHLVHLGEADAEAARKFFTEVATSRAEVATKLHDFNRLYEQGSQHQTAGQISVGNQLMEHATTNLDQAKAAADRLIVKAKSATSLVARLSD